MHEISPTSPSYRFRQEEDEIGVLLDAEGFVPPEANGRHCRYCGEGIEVSLDHGGGAQPGSVQEFRHTASGTVHCVLVQKDGVRVEFDEDTAQPCWKDGCLSHAGHDARPDDPQDR